MHYYSFNIGDYRRDTAHLSLLEHGVYRQLLDTYYLHESPLPISDDEIIRFHLARSTQEKQAVRTVLNEFFILTDEGWIHHKCDKVIQEYYAKSEKARESANVRWSNRSERNANAMRTHSEGNADGMLTINHKPITNNQEPSTKSHKPDSEPSGSVNAGDFIPPRAPKKPAKGEHTWAAYAGAYENRHGVPPVRNATTNGQIARLVDRLGAEEAPQVAAFYVNHNNQYYVAKGHSVGLLLQDAEKLRTEWATGRKVTQTSARQMDKTQSNLDSHNEALAILAAKGYNVA